MSRADVLPEEKQYALVEVDKGADPDDAATKLFESDDLIDTPPDGPLEFYVVYDRDGNVVTDAVENKAEIPDNAVSVSDESEIPEDAQKIEGPRGGTYYVVGAGDASKDELIDALETVASGDPAAEGQVDAIATHAEDREEVMEAIQELQPDMQEQVFDELDGSSYEDASTQELIDAASEVAAQDVVETIADPDMDPDEVRDNFDEYLSDSQITDIQNQLTDVDGSTEPDWESVPDYVPRRPEETEEAWEENYQDELIAQAEQHDMEPDEYREALADEYSRVLENSQAAVRIPTGFIEQVLDDGRIKNQHETGSSSGWLDPELREDFESDYMGVDPDTPDSDKPIYGYASAEDARIEDEPIDLENYGGASLRLSDDVKERSTSTFGDSLGANRGWEEGNRDLNFTPTPTADPDEKAFSLDRLPVGHDEDTHLEMLQNADDPTDLEMYNEMQVHGGIDADQIEEVRFNASKEFHKSPDDELLDRLDEAGIPYEVES